MTKENAKDYLPFVQALAEGKTIQHYYREFDGWRDADEPCFGDKAEYYRIKPDELWYVVKHTNGQLGIVDNDRMVTVDYLYSATEKEDCERWIADHKPQYVPFDSVEELIECWNQKKNSGKPTYDTKLNMPIIWVESKGTQAKRLITEYRSASVGFSTSLYNLKDLYACYTFLDGTPIGKIKE